LQDIKERSNKPSEMKTAMAENKNTLDGNNVLDTID